MKRSQEIIERIKKGTPNHYKPLPVVLSNGNGCWAKDVDGKWYLDGLSCYSAVNWGHNNPVLKKAIIDQLDTGLTTSSNAFYNERQDYNTRLAEFCGYDKALIMNTGAEAVEAALKLARKWYEVNGGLKNKAKIIVCDNNFHGRTTTIISFSSELLYRDGFGPYTPGFISVPYGDIDALEKEMSQIPAAVLMEPIQGEGGVIAPPEGYLSAVRSLCRDRGSLFILDEIQTGLGRTGKMFAWQYEGESARPDVMILGKSLGSVVPVSAVLADKEKMDAVFTPGTHGSTYANNPLACAAGHAVLDFIEQEEKLLSSVYRHGNWLKKQIKAINCPYIKEVRGEGLLIGIELHPDARGARRFCEMLAELEPRGILCKETHENVIRFAPPLIITKEELEWAFKKIEYVLENCKF